ncbi:hypothetical protein GCM10027048_03160 [Hymenobacter coalescens]
MADNFPTLELRAPLFYNWPKALRFDLQASSPGEKGYFQEVQRQATALLEAAFAPTDTVFLVLMDRRYRRRKIRFTGFSFRQIQGLRRSEVGYARLQQRYERDEWDKWNLAVIQLTLNRLLYRNVLQAIANTDFQPRQPRLDGRGVLSNQEVYLLNVDRKLIFHMYDDRGLDLLATDLEVFRPVYEQFNGWLLDYDRSRMEAALSVPQAP